MSVSNSIQFAENIKIFRKGLFLVIIGPDGSGKTTISDGIKFSFGQRVFKQCLYIHKDFGFLPQLKTFKRLLPFRKKSVTVLQKSNSFLSGMTKPNTRLKALIYVLYYFFDFILGHFLIANAKRKEYLVIADRYFYDYFYQLAYCKFPWSILRFLSFWIPKPDLLIYLYADPEVIHKRKPELTIDEIKRQHKNIEKLCSSFKFMIKVNTNDSPEESIKMLHQKILLMMAIQQQKN